MRSLRSVITMVLVGMCLGGLSGCAAVLMTAPVSKSGDGWSITLDQAKEGPNEYVSEGVEVSSGKGERLIWTIVTVKNESSQEETFSYDTCLLQGKAESHKPLVVDRNAGPEVFSAADRDEPIALGQDRTRLLIYTFSKAQPPTRMKCGAIVLPLQGPR